MIPLVFLLEREQAGIGEPIDEEPAVEVIELVLEHRREEAVQFELPRLALVRGVARPSRAAAARRSRAGPATERQPSQYPRVAGSSTSMTGLTNTVSGIGASSPYRLGPPGISMIASRTDSPICGAASPMPP